MIQKVFFWNQIAKSKVHLGQKWPKIKTTQKRCRQIKGEKNEIMCLCSILLQCDIISATALLNAKSAASLTKLLIRILKESCSHLFSATGKYDSCPLTRVRQNSLRITVWKSRWLWNSSGKSSWLRLLCHTYKLDGCVYKIICKRVGNSTLNTNSLGQLVSEWIFGVYNFPKMQRKNC